MGHAPTDLPSTKAFDEKYILCPFWYPPTRVFSSLTRVDPSPLSRPTENQAEPHRTSAVDVFTKHRPLHSRGMPAGLCHIPPRVRLNCKAIPTPLGGGGQCCPAQALQGTLRLPFPPGVGEICPGGVLFNVLGLLTGFLSFLSFLRSGSARASTAFHQTSPTDSSRKP